MKRSHSIRREPPAHARRHARAAARQRGAVLIVSLILLVVLTLLGVTAMNSTSLDEKMAANNQQTTRAFQAAESGLSATFNNNAAYNLANDPANPYKTTVSIPSSGSDQASITGSFVGWSAPPAGSLYSATSFQAAHFNFTSQGTTNGGAIQTVLQGGAYQIAPKQN